MLCMFGRTAKHHEIHDARRRALFQARKLACLAGQWTNVAWAIHFADVRV